MDSANTRSVILDTINALLGGLQKLTPPGVLMDGIQVFRAFSPIALRMSETLAANPDVADEILWLDWSREIMRQRAVLKFGKFGKFGK
jgi:hypothetical protein